MRMRGMADNFTSQTLTIFDDRVTAEPKPPFSAEDVAAKDVRAASPPQQSAHSRNLPSVIAIVGCDGAGKSTLAADLSAALSADLPVTSVYLGQDSGNILKAIVAIPLVGGLIGRFLVRKSQKAHADKDKSSAPDAITAIAIYLLSRWRRHKFAGMRKLHDSGQVIIADRYPQAEVPGFYFDGRGLIASEGSNAFLRALASQEQRLYDEMASYVPALIIRLHIDADTAHKRKPDHKLAMLREKTRVIPTLHFNAAPILELDGRDNYADILHAALTAARRCLAPTHHFAGPN